MRKQTFAFLIGLAAPHERFKAFGHERKIANIERDELGAAEAAGGASVIRANLAGVVVKMKAKRSSGAIRWGRHGSWF